MNNLNNWINRHALLLAIIMIVYALSSATLGTISLYYKQCLWIPTCLFISFLLCAISAIGYLTIWLSNKKGGL